MADITIDKLTLPTALRMPVNVRGYAAPQSRYPVRIAGFRPRPAKFDLSFDRGPFRITGTVKTKGTPHTPVRRRVVLVVERAGRAIAETWSDPTTGRYEFNSITDAHRYTVIAFDHAGLFDAVLADNISPERMP